MSKNELPTNNSRESLPPSILGLLKTALLVNRETEKEVRDLLKAYNDRKDDNNERTAVTRSKS